MGIELILSKSKTSIGFSPDQHDSSYPGMLGRLRIAGNFPIAGRQIAKEIFLSIIRHLHRNVQRKLTH